MKEVVILALKDREGNFYSCNAHISDYAPGNPARLYLDHEVDVPVVEIFPYTHFSSFSTHDQEQFEFTQIHALVELSDDEYVNLTCGDVRKYKFYKRKVQAIRELTTPFAFSWQVFEKWTSLREYLEASSVRYGTLTWLHLFGFKNDDEFEIYLRFMDTEKLERQYVNNYKFTPTRFNKGYFEKALNYGIPIDLHYGIGDAVFKTNQDDLFREINKFSFEAFTNFHRFTYFGHLDKTNKHRVNKTFFDAIISREGKDFARYVSFMPKRVILEYGADNLLERVFPEMDYMLTETGYVPEKQCCYDFDYEDHSDACIPHIYDGRDSEVDILVNILPCVTEKSLPLLRHLVFEKIEEYLPEKIKEQLLAA